MKIYYFSGGSGVRPSRFFNSNGREITYRHKLNLGPRMAFIEGVYRTMPHGHIDRNYVIQHNGKKYRPKAPKMIRPIPDPLAKPGVRGYGHLYEIELEPVSNNTRVSGPIPQSFVNNWARRHNNAAAQQRVNEALYLTFQKYKAGTATLRNNALNNLANAYNSKWRKHVMNTWFASNNAKKGPPGPLFRGVRTASRINKNGTYTNKLYSSWTTNRNVARQYATQNNRNGYILRLVNSAGNRPYVRYNNSRPTFARNSEHEVILGPGTFRVKVNRAANNA